MTIPKNHLVGLRTRLTTPICSMRSNSALCTGENILSNVESTKQSTKRGRQVISLVQQEMHQIMRHFIYKNWMSQKMCSYKCWVQFYLNIEIPLFTVHCIFFALYIFLDKSNIKQLVKNNFDHIKRNYYVIA